MSASASVILTSGRGIIFGSEYWPPTIKLSRLVSSKAFRTFYYGGTLFTEEEYYSLVNRTVLITPTPDVTPCITHAGMHIYFSVMGGWYLLLQIYLKGRDLDSVVYNHSF